MRYRNNLENSTNAGDFRVPRGERAEDGGQIEMFGRDESVDVTRLPYSLSGS